MSEEKVVHLTGFQADHIRRELEAVRQRLLDEGLEDETRLSLLRLLIEALEVPKRPPTSD